MSFPYHKKKVVVEIHTHEICDVIKIFDRQLDFLFP